MDNIDTLRSMLFDTLRDLRDKDKPMDIGRAKAVCEVAAQITETAKVELQLMSVTKQRVASSFLPDAGAQRFHRKVKRFFRLGFR